MGLLQPLDAEQGYLKAGFLGFAKSGKTFTALQLAVGTRQFFELDGPIAFCDTEGGVTYLRKMIREWTGKGPVGLRSRAFDDMLGLAREAEQGGVSVLIVDSVTHVWRELCDAYLKQLNEVREQKHLSSKRRLEFQDWNVIKAKWSEWTDFYLNSKLHIIICGRAGFEWDFEEHEQSDGTMRKELVKHGVKMKVESEFGFEPSLLVEMERVQQLGEKTQILHRATVIGDRFDAIDGAQADNPAFPFFKPHVACLSSGGYAPIDTAVKTNAGVDEEGRDEFQRERRAKVVCLEEIQGEIVALFPGQTNKDKAGKVDLLQRIFGTKSWTKVESFDLASLKAGLTTLRERKDNAKTD